MHFYPHPLPIGIDINMNGFGFEWPRISKHTEGTLCMGISKMAHTHARTLTYHPISVPDVRWAVPRMVSRPCTAFQVKHSLWLPQ